MPEPPSPSNDLESSRFVPFRRLRRVRAAILPPGILLLAAVLVGVLPSSAPAAQSDVDEARARADEAAAEFTAAEADVGNLEGDVARLQSQLDRTRGEYGEASRVAGQLAVDRYVKAGSDLDLFATQDVNLQARAAAFSRLVSQHETDDADRYLALRQDLEALQKRLDQRLADQRQAVKDLDDLRQSLFAELARLEEAERAAEAARQAATAAAAAASASAAAAAAAASSAAAAASSADASAGGAGGESADGGSGGGSDDSGEDDSHPVARVRGGDGFACPVAGATSFSDSWGDSRSGGRRHQGVDMFAGYGTPVVAVVGGVAEENSGGAGGIGIVLQGDDGVQYYYAHLSEIATTGAVSAGEVIAYVGDTGNAVSTPHLHFEVHPGGWGTATNPYDAVAPYC